MADITISDLELAPALTDDMVLPVENTTDTYAATLAMLRRKINKTFVEVEDADFNDLTNDGFYQCTGTPTNAPEVGAINWTLQVSAESGVVVQRAFSLDDRFENFYIRRFNGVMWTAWKNMTNVVGTPFSLGDSRYFETAPYNVSLLASNGQYNSSFVYPSMWGQLQVELSNIKVGEVGNYNGYSYTKRGLPVVLSTDTYTDYDFVVNQNDQTFRLPLLNGEEDTPSMLRYIDVPLPTSGQSTQPAPANGYYTILGYAPTGSVPSQTNPMYVTLVAGGKNQRAIGTTTNALGVTVAACKDMTCYVEYSNFSITSQSYAYFRFYYNKGNGTLYYYVGDTVQDASLINAGAVLGQLSDKISRTVASDKELVVGWGMPDYSAVVDLRSIFIGGSRSYTAPVKGFFIGNWHLVNAAITVNVNGIDVGYDVAAPNETNNVSVCLKLDVGDVLTASGNPSGNNGIFRFFPLKGA